MGAIFDSNFGKGSKLQITLRDENRKQTNYGNYIRYWFGNDYNSYYGTYKLEGKQKDIVKDLESIFTKANKQDLGNQKVSSFPDGNSYKNDVSFYFKDGSMVHTACYDYSPKDTSTQDRLSIAILSKQYLDWFWSL